jgi:hypothetical protein
VSQWGAHFQVIFLVKRQQRGRTLPQILRFSSGSPAPDRNSCKERPISPEKLDSHPSRGAALASES